MEIDLVMQALDRGAAATKGLLASARQMEPGERARLVGDLQQRQAQLKTVATVTKRNHENLAAARARMSRNPESLGSKVINEQEEATTRATLDGIQEQHAALGGMVLKLQALDVNLDVLADMQSEGHIEKRDSSQTGEQ